MALPQEAADKNTSSVFSDPEMGQHVSPRSFFCPALYCRASWPLSPWCLGRSTSLPGGSQFILTSEEGLQSLWLNLCSEELGKKIRSLEK